VLTLLVFGVYSRLIENNPLLLSIIKRAEAICIATKEVRRLHAERHVRDALAMRNGLNTSITLDLPI
jgi:hypothetical protein